MEKTPLIEWGEETEFPTYILKRLYYNGEPFQGKATRVFAYYAVPKYSGRPLPAIALVHGGAGKAFPQWAEQWAEKGYAAIAMDLFGCGEDGGKLPDGGPAQSDDSVFRDIANGTLTDMWLYHSVAAAVRSVSFLQAQPEVDDKRIGMMGISWGGYTSLLASSFDTRLAYAMIVYASGYLRESSCWMDVMAEMDASHLKMWDDNFDAARYVGQTSIPHLLATGTNDTCYFLDSWRKTRALIGSNVTVRVVEGWDHNYDVPWGAKEFFAYAEAMAKGGAALPKMGIVALSGKEAQAAVAGSVNVRAVNLVYTAGGDRPHEMEWLVKPAEWHPARNIVSCGLPAEAAHCLFTVEDEYGNVVSTDIVTI